VKRNSGIENTLAEKIHRVIPFSQQHSAKANNKKHGINAEPQMSAYKTSKAKIGGSGEIRTHEGLSSSLVFKTSAFNRSATLPYQVQQTKESQVKSRATP
jgi:hypothetical protein